MKGIILAGGKGTRLHPITLGVSKQLLPVYDKPMIYYPLSVLLLAGIREILLITTADDQCAFQRLLGTGEQWGVHLTYAIQEEPRGIAEAFLIGKDFIHGDRVALILGDNIFYGNHLGPLLEAALTQKGGATLFGYRVRDPERYGVATLDEQGTLIGIEEKPSYPSSNIAVTGLYFYDREVVSIVESLNPSARGELEISEVNRHYLEQGKAILHLMGRGFAWFDAGTYGSLMQAGQFVQVIQERQGCQIAALEEIAYREGWIRKEHLLAQSKRLGNSPYGLHIQQMMGPRHERPFASLAGVEKDHANTLPR